MHPRPRLIGTIHLAPLPGSALGGPASDLPRILDRAVQDALAYREGGFDAVIVENFGDIPFRKGDVGPHVVAAVTLAAANIRRESGLPVGVNVLRNDVRSAVAIAALAGGSFVRANVYAGAAVTDQGVIEGDAEGVQAYLRRIGAAVDIWADIDVKHAAQLAPRPLGNLAEDAVVRGLAAAVIVTGRATGQPASFDDLRAVRTAVPGAGMYVGSGATTATIGELLTVADGAIVGTAAKIGGVVTNPVDPARVRQLVEAAHQG